MGIVSGTGKNWDVGEGEERGRFVAHGKRDFFMKAGELVVSNLFSNWRRKVMTCGKDTRYNSPRTTSRRG